MISSGSRALTSGISGNGEEARSTEGFCLRLSPEAVEADADVLVAVWMLPAWHQIQSVVMLR